MKGGGRWRAAARALSTIPPKFLVVCLSSKPAGAGGGRVAQPAAIKYRAFLSYSHRDKAWGRWLHSALEGYRIDKDLVGRETSAGPVPKTLRPIFRDREDFSAGHSLTEQTLAALEASQFLIVHLLAQRGAAANTSTRKFAASRRWVAPSASSR